MKSKANDNKQTKIMKKKQIQLSILYKTGLKGMKSRNLERLFVLYSDCNVKGKKCIRERQNCGKLYHYVTHF